MVPERRSVARSTLVAMPVYIGRIKLLGISIQGMSTTLISTKYIGLVEIGYKAIVRGEDLFIPARARISLLGPNTKFLRHVEIGEVPDVDVLIGADLLVPHLSFAQEVLPGSAPLYALPDTKRGSVSRLPC